MRLWRLSTHAELDGAGGLYASARWHSRGRPIIYAALSPTGALVEVLVHLELKPADLPTGFRLLGFDLPDGIEPSGPPSLPRDWAAREMLTRARGDAWLKRAATPALRVPSAIIGHTDNILVNPVHPALAGALTPAINEPFRFDARLLAKKL